MTKRREKSLAKRKKRKRQNPKNEALPISIFYVFSKFGCGGPAARKRCRHGNGAVTSAQSFFSAPLPLINGIVAQKGYRGKTLWDSVHK